MKNSCWGFRGDGEIATASLHAQQPLRAASAARAGDERRRKLAFLRSAPPPSALPHSAVVPKRTSPSWWDRWVTNPADDALDVKGSADEDGGDAERLRDPDVARGRTPRLPALPSRPSSQGTVRLPPLRTSLATTDEEAAHVVTEPDDLLPARPSTSFEMYRQLGSTFHATRVPIELPLSSLRRPNSSTVPIRTLIRTGRVGDTDPVQSPRSVIDWAASSTPRSARSRSRPSTGRAGRPPSRPDGSSPPLGGRGGVLGSPSLSGLAKSGLRRLGSDANYTTKAVLAPRAEDLAALPSPRTAFLEEMIDAQLIPEPVLSHPGTAVLAPDLTFAEDVSRAACEDLNLAHFGIGDERGTALARSFACATTGLCRLNLADNRFSGPVLHRIVETALRFRSLRALTLSDNEVRWDGNSKDPVAPVRWPTFRRILFILHIRPRTPHRYCRPRCSS